MTSNSDASHLTIPSGFADSHFDLRELRAESSCAPVKSGTRENVPLVKLYNGRQFNRACGRRPSCPLSWIRDEDALLGADSNIPRQERNVICIFWCREWLWATTRQLEKKRRRLANAQLTSPKDLKDNDPSCLLLACTCASLGRITSSACIVTCRKLFAA